MSMTISLNDYPRNGIHYAIAVGDQDSLSRIISALPTLPDPSRAVTESDSLSHERIANDISSVLDLREGIPYRESPLHLAVRLNDVLAVRALVNAGSDISLQNAAGWSPLDEAISRGSSEIAHILVFHYHLAAWAKWRRRLPSVVAVLGRMRDFYMEISFHFDSKILPFVRKTMPSDTIRIWKRGGNLRADTNLAGFHGITIKRADQSILFLGEDDAAAANGVSQGSLVVLNRTQKKIFDAFKNAGSPMSDAAVSKSCSKTKIHRPGIDVTKAEISIRTTWCGQEKTQMVGEWKAKVYDVKNVAFSLRSRKVAGSESGDSGSFDEDVLPLELDGGGRRHIGSPSTKEKVFKMSRRPSVWLTEQFPLKTEELLPLLDLLAHKLKAVRRVRELLTTKLPEGTFPVKITIPTIVSVRLVMTMKNFVELPPTHSHLTTEESDPFTIPTGYTWKVK